VNIPKDYLLLLLKDKIYISFNFSSNQLNKFKTILDWKQISANQVMDWNYHVIKEFEYYWDWEILQQNRAVNNRLTLGLLFPDRVELPTCNCSFKYDFCECENANWYNGNWEKGYLNSDRFNYKPMPSATETLINAMVYNLSEELLENILKENDINNELLLQYGITLK